MIMVVAPSRTGPRDMGSRAPSAAAGANPYSPHPVPLVARAGLAEARAVPSCSSSYVEFEARPPWTVGSRFELHRRVLSAAGTVVGRIVQVADAPAKDGGVSRRLGRTRHRLGASAKIGTRAAAQTGGVGGAGRWGSVLARNPRQCHLRRRVVIAG